MLKVLIVEDEETWFGRLRFGFQGKAEVLWGETITHAEEIFSDNPDIDLIMMDACVPGDKPNTIPLVEKIVASGFDKPIIAISSSEKYNNILINAGAKHKSSKFNASQMALKLLGL